MRRIFILPLALAALSTLGCPPGGPQPGAPSASPSVTTSPTPIPSGATLTGVYSDQGIDISGGAIDVVATANGQPIPNAAVNLYGETLAFANTDASGHVTLGPLVAGTDYRLVVSAPGYATLQVGNIVVTKPPAGQSAVPTSERPTLSAGATVSGQVTAGGSPVVGAVVSDGLNSALTDSQGNYQLQGVAIGSVSLAVSKPRYQTASRQLTVSASGATGTNVTLTASSPVVYFDSTVASGVSLSSLSGLQKQLQSLGWTLASQPPSSSGVWVVVCPSQTLSADAISRISTFAAQGGKVVLIGEWGGFNGFNNPAANALAHAVGLHFNPDLIDDPAANPLQWLTITSFPSNLSVTNGLTSLKLYTACSLFGLPPMQSLAQTSAGAYRIQNNGSTGAHNVVIGGPFRGGKAIALGDTSAWSDEATAGAGTPDLQQADNARFFAQLLDW